MGRRFGRSWLVAAGFGLAVLAPIAAQARTFSVLRSANGSWTLVDPLVVETSPESGLRRIWTVTVQRNILDGAPPMPGYVRTLSEVDCARQRARWLKFSAFSRSGKLLVTQDNASLEWSTTGEPLAALRIVCGASYGDAVISADSVGAAVLALMQSWDAPAAPAVPPPARPKTGKRR